MDINILLDIYGDEPLCDAVREMDGEDLYTVCEAVKSKNEPTTER